MAAAVSGLSPVIITVRMPILRSAEKRSRMPPFTMSFRWMTPKSLRSLATASGVPPVLAMRSDSAVNSDDTGDGPAQASTASTAPLRMDEPSRSTPRDARLGRERNEVRVHRRHLAATQAILLLRQHHDRAAFRRLIRERGKLRRIGQTAIADAGQRQEFRRLAIAERDRARLVEEERVDVTRGFHGAARHGKHIEAHEAIHAGDADGGKERADGGGDQRHEQRHQHQHADVAAGVMRKARDRGNGEDEDDRHAGEQDVQRDFVRRLLTLRTFDQRDHAVEEGRALRRGDLHLDPVGDDGRAARDGRTVAAGFRG